MKVVLREDVESLGRKGDLLDVAGTGLRTRRLRAALSALGIAIGIAAMVAVLGISTSSRADLLVRLDRLGTNLLRVTPGETFFGAELGLVGSVEVHQGEQQLADVVRFDAVMLVAIDGAAGAPEKENGIFVLRVLPGFERYKPVHGFSRTLAPRLQPDDVLLTYDEALPSLVFYLRRHVDSLFLPDEVFERFRLGRTVYAVMSKENYREIGGRIPVPTCIIDRRPTFDVKLRNVLGKESLPELLLITNRCVP